ncbi:hypothetical protein CKO51_06375 [Rhodopirellula sp. SM50]|nr:hypothetical protein CKO51_06375 [Rhodopirellula sp. SM50]
MTLRTGHYGSKEPPDHSLRHPASAQLQVWYQPPLSNYRPRSFDRITARTVLLMFYGAPVDGTPPMSNQ